MSLSDAKVRKAVPREKPYKLFDERGLYLIVQPEGGRWWRLRFKLEGREKTLSLGTYPEVSLAEARRRRDRERAKLLDGRDPAAERRERKAARRAEEQRGQPLRKLLADWQAKKAGTWSPSTAKVIAGRLERFVLPALGDTPVSEITTTALLDLLRPLEAAGKLETAHRCRQYLREAFDYGIATGVVPANPAAPLRGALQTKQAKHHAALTDPKEVGALLRAIDGFQGEVATRCALRLAPLVFVRPGELRTMRWEEVDLDAATWTIPAAKTKMRRDHLVPLASQAVEILRELQRFTGDGELAFPSVRGRGRPMSDNTLNAALRRLGYSREQMTAHGFRAMARTLLDEVLGERPDVIEHQLAHMVRDPLGRAYNRTQHLPARRAMMQRWADYLDGLRRGAEVVPLRGSA
jgi:integrase